MHTTIWTASRWLKRNLNWVLSPILTALPGTGPISHFAEKGHPFSLDSERRAHGSFRFTAMALKYGPLIYNVETADNGNIDRKPGDGPLRAEWRPDLLGGVMVISGKWQDGSPMLAIPNFARTNRVGPPHDYPSDDEVGHSLRSKPSIESKVWI